MYSQPADNWQNFQKQPMNASIGAIIGVVTNSQNPNKLTGDWCFYVNNKDIPKIEINPNLYAYNPSLDNARLVMPLDMSEVHFQCLQNSRKAYL